jgi:NUMOD4 motif
MKCLIDLFLSRREMWVQIEGFPDYSVSTSGEVRHDSNLRLLRPQINQLGIPYVGMMRDNEQKQRSLARLVANAYLPRFLEAFDTPINLDGDRMNCAVENLMWRPRWFAIRYNRQFKEPYYRRIEAPLRAIEDSEVHSSSIEAAIRYGLLERDICLSIEHRTYVWPTYQIFELV